jgi:hemoglobin
MADWTPSPADTPFLRLGGEPAVRALVTRFYDAMEEQEPLLAALHECDPPGRLTANTRERFSLFLIGWLGGPQDYTAKHGHPRLRMRHARVPVNAAMRDAWLRCMKRALDGGAFEPAVRAFVEERLTEVADFLRNAP